MRIGFIGAGKAGCSMGKYFSEKALQANIQVSGYYSLIEEEAEWAATFTDSEWFHSIDEVIANSDSIILSTPDGAIKNVWDIMKKDQLEGKYICHFSGSLSSDVFSGIEQYGAYPISIHPMFAFSDKESVYLQLNEVSFTLEGHKIAVEAWKTVFYNLGNSCVEIEKDVKPKYHAAASLLSNHVIAVLETGYQLLQECGFTEEQARTFSSVLVEKNVENVIHMGSKAALTGPIERADCETVEKHLAVMSNEALYRVCGNVLLTIAKEKNPQRDYKEIEALLDING